jgi:hypothetical protein
MPGLVHGGAASGSPASVFPLDPELPLLDPELPLLDPELPLVPPLELPLDPDVPLDPAVPLDPLVPDELLGSVAESVVCGANRSCVVAPLHADTHAVTTATLEARTRAAACDFMTAEFHVTERRCPTRRAHGSDSFVSPIERSFRSVTRIRAVRADAECARA